jgi:hypothetical protein
MGPRKKRRSERNKARDQIPEDPKRIIQKSSPKETSKRKVHIMKSSESLKRNPNAP